MKSFIFLFIIFNDFNSNQMSWIDCVADKDYQIFSEEPYQIRRKTNKRIVKEHISKSTGYITCSLNNKPYSKHAIIAKQFIPNPNNLPYVDHINRIKTDNRIDNLRFVSCSDNNKNKTSNNGVIYNYVDKLNDNSFEFTEYGNHHFTNYFYDIDADKFYYFNGFQYRELPYCKRSNTGFVVYIIDDNNMKCEIRVNKFKKLYNIIH